MLVVDAPKGFWGLDRSRSRLLLWIVAPTLVAAGLRWYALGANALWVDELATLQIARHPFARIPEAALHGDAFEPPLFFWLIRLITRVAGESEVAVRVTSALAGIITVPLLWGLVREASGSSQAAGLTTMFAAVHPLLLWYSQEARPYALLVTLGLASLLSLVLALGRGGWSYWIAYAGFGALALLTHAVAVVFPATALVWVLLSEQRRWVLPRFVIASAGMLVAVAPFAFALVRAASGAEGTGSPPRPITGLELPYTLFTFVAGYSFGPAVREIQDQGWKLAASAHPTQTAIVIAALILWLVIVARRPTRGAAWFAALLAIPVLATFTGSVITTKAYNVRYALPAVAGFVALLALGLEAAPPRSRLLVAGPLLAVFLWADLQWFTVSRYWKEDSRSAVECLSRVLPANGRVAVAPTYMASVIGHYAAVAGTSLQAEGVQSPRDLRSGSVPPALVLTRLHHVPEARGLVAAFDSAAAGPTTRAEVPGYRLHFAGPTAAGVRDCGGRE